MTDLPLRYELKLLCDASHLAQVRAWIRMHPAALRRAYPPRRVNSLYFDTPHLSALNTNLAGLNVRNKLRCRWYGDQLPIIYPHLELKHKHNLLGFKKQIVLSCEFDLTQSWTRFVHRLRTHVGSTWHALLQSVNQPTLLNRYWREYYVMPDGYVRVTVDSAQVAYDQRLASRPNLTRKLPIDDTLIIEIKADHEHADRVQAVVDAFPLPRTRNSKYAEGMLTALYTQ